jgi:hypothetical protein
MLKINVRLNKKYVKYTNDTVKSYIFLFYSGICIQYDEITFFILILSIPNNNIWFFIFIKIMRS